jgi:hypothetical protein
LRFSIDDLNAERKTVYDHEIWKADEESGDSMAHVDAVFHETKREHGRKPTLPESIDKYFPSKESSPAKTTDDERRNEDGGFPGVGFEACFLEGKDSQDGGCDDESSSDDI